MNIGTANMQENSWANRLKISNIKILSRNPEMQESSRLQGWQQINVVLSNFKPTSTAKALCHVSAAITVLWAMLLYTGVSVHLSECKQAQKCLASVNFLLPIK